MPFTVPDDWPLNRKSQLAHLAGDLPSLANGWANSCKVLTNLREQFAAAQLGDAVSVVAVAGSLGRMESAIPSDIDTLIVTDSDQSATDVSPAIAVINRAINAVGYTPPKPGGVFAQSAVAEKIIAVSDVGRLDESVATFGKRIHFLLEAQPVRGRVAHESLTSAIVQRWGQSPGDEVPWWVYLQNDIVRYWRALQIDYQWRHHKDAPRFWRRHAKLHLSRRTAVAGLLFLVGAATTRSDSVDWLVAALRLAPLERVAAALAGTDPNLARTFLSGYDSAHQRLADTNFLRHLDTGTGEAAGLRALRHSTDELTCLLADLIASRPRWACSNYWNQLIL